MKRKTAALFIFAGGLAFATAVGAQGQTPSGSTMPKSDTGTMQSSAKPATGVNASATATALADLKSGQSVMDSTGTTLGKVTRIETSMAGTFRWVQVATTGGTSKIMNLAPDTLTVSNGVVTTTAMPKAK